MNYHTNEEIAKGCYVVPAYRTNFDKQFRHVYDPLALNSVAAPPLNNPALQADFLGTPTGLNLMPVEKYTPCTNCLGGCR